MNCLKLTCIKKMTKKNVLELSICDVENTFILQNHCCILYSVIGWNSVIGEWTRVEGTPNDPNPNKPFAKLDIPDLFNSDGRLNPSITVIGKALTIGE